MEIATAGGVKRGERLALPRHANFTLDPAGTGLAVLNDFRSMSAVQLNRTAALAVELLLAGPTLARAAAEYSRQLGIGSAEGEEALTRVLAHLLDQGWLVWEAEDD